VCKRSSGTNANHLKAVPSKANEKQTTYQGIEKQDRLTMSLVLIDATSDSLTVSWPETPKASRYVLQYRKATNSDKEEFDTLSDKLTTTQARKRNLSDETKTGFIFRAGAVQDGSDDVISWRTHSEPFHLLSEADEKDRATAPTVSNVGSNAAVVVRWNSTDNATGYELQMRENVGGAQWNVIAPSLAGTEVRKKNLKSKAGFQFRVRPIITDSSVFSPPSDPIVALGLSEGMKKFFSSLENGRLLQSVKEKPVPLADALGGKEFVLLYVSAHWCGPCRQYTPTLAKWYQSQGANKLAEVVFLSADHDLGGFQKYYKSMPWLAVEYDDDAREQLMSYLRVSGIPRLVVLDGQTGRIIEDNAVGKQLDLNHWRKLASGK
jgi:thiol-disulfide isomerase/thioredoxin